jgi:murein DD-endopeptidase MepM/ murein hydrolase activator NlpD
MNTITRAIFTLIIAVSLMGASDQIAEGSNQFQQPIASVFSPPLGFNNGVRYSPRFTKDNSGNLIENTDYGITNPDLSHFSNCFGTNMSNLYHAGQDLYRFDGQSTAGAEVTAVADGVVSDYSSSGNYPGRAIVIKHLLSSGQYVYSVYMHLENIAITQGQSVIRGQRLGTVIFQPYDGNFPQYHPAPLNDDSHIHFEMRLFPSAANIYTDHPACNLGDAPGRGYTLPQLPDNFPTPATGYRNPRTYIKERLYLPCILKQEPTCISGQQLLANGGFESGTAGWVELREPGYAIITNYLLPTTAYSGSWVAWFGGRINSNERIYQEFSVASGMTNANLSFYIWMGTDETTSGAYDKLYVRLRDSSDNLIQQLDYIDNNFTEHVWLYRSTSLPDLSSRSGQTLRLSFEGTNDGSLITHFLVDNTSLTAVCSGSYAPQSSQPLALPTNPPQRISGGAEPTRPPAPTPTLPPYPNP